MLQLFGGKLGLDLFVGVAHFRWSGEPPCIPVWVLALAVSGCEQCPIGIVRLLSGLTGLLVEPCWLRSPAIGELDESCAQFRKGYMQ
jgi:hypothetical protein